MTYTIYGAAGSGSVPVEAALTLIGAPFEVVERKGLGHPDSICDGLVEGR